ncbi:unnamed protein product [Colias eurytheme]|nr:unnamed protein product [Colias eurytheme]
MTEVKTTGAEQTTMSALFLDGITKFSGDDKSVSSTKWAQDEDNSEIFNWTSQQKLIFARRSLVGTAELWLKSEKTFKSYDELKTALQKEFPDTANTKEMHEVMSSRKKQKNESYYEYMLIMKELGRRAKFPDYVSVQYIIDGISDYEPNKSILYGANSYATLKEKLSLYEKMKAKMKNNVQEFKDNVNRRSTSSRETLNKLEIHQQTFGNPRRIITDRGTAFTSHEFTEYCKEEDIEHVKITTGVPRGNGQVERIHKIIIPILTKLCMENSGLWYRHVSRVQRAINSTYQRSINCTPFDLLIKTRMRVKEDIKIQELLQEEYILQSFNEDREELRKQAKEQVFKVQEENSKYFNKNRKISLQYKVGDLVAIKRTQFGSGLKLKPKYLGALFFSR